MTGRQAILEYLRTHKNFCAHDLATAYGISQKGINRAARLLEMEGLLVVDIKAWRAVFYRMATREEQEGRRSTNVIFQECRQSESMKRVLAFYGRASA